MKKLTKIKLKEQISIETLLTCRGADDNIFKYRNFITYKNNENESSIGAV